MGGIRLMRLWIGNPFARTGDGLILDRLETYDQEILWKQAQRRLRTLKKSREVLELKGFLNSKKTSKYRHLIRVRNQILTRLQIAMTMGLSTLKPKWIILHCLPVLPPELRPILFLGEGKV